MRILRALLSFGAIVVASSLHAQERTWEQVTLSEELVAQYQEVGREVLFRLRYNNPSATEPEVAMVTVLAPRDPQGSPGVTVVVVLDLERLFPNTNFVQPGTMGFCPDANGDCDFWSFDDPVTLIDCSKKRPGSGPLFLGCTKDNMQLMRIEGFFGAEKFAREIKDTPARLAVSMVADNGVTYTYNVRNTGLADPILSVVAAAKPKPQDGSGSTTDDAGILSELKGWSPQAAVCAEPNWQVYDGTPTGEGRLQSEVDRLGNCLLDAYHVAQARAIDIAVRSNSIEFNRTAQRFDYPNDCRICWEINNAAIEKLKLYELDLVAQKDIAVSTGQHLVRANLGVDAFRQALTCAVPEPMHLGSLSNLETQEDRLERFGSCVSTRAQNSQTAIEDVYKGLGFFIGAGGALSWSQDCHGCQVVADFISRQGRAVFSEFQEAEEEVKRQSHFVRASRSTFQALTGHDLCPDPGLPSSVAGYSSAQIADLNARVSTAGECVLDLKDTINSTYRKAMLDGFGMYYDEGADIYRRKSAAAPCPECASISTFFKSVHDTEIARIAAFQDRISAQIDALNN